MGEVYKGLFIEGVIYNSAIRATQRQTGGTKRRLFVRHGACDVRACRKCVSCHLRSPWLKDVLTICLLFAVALLSQTQYCNQSLTLSSRKSTCIAPANLTNALIRIRLFWLLEMRCIKMYTALTDSFITPHRTFNIVAASSTHDIKYSEDIYFKAVRANWRKSDRKGQRGAITHIKSFSYSDRLLPES